LQQPVNDGDSRGARRALRFKVGCDMSDCRTQAQRFVHITTTRLRSNPERGVALQQGRIRNVDAGTGSRVKEFTNIVPAMQLPSRQV
jgi:hypothetical protein